MRKSSETRADPYDNQKSVRTMEHRRITALAIVIMFSLSMMLGIPKIPLVKASGGMALDGHGLGSSNMGSFCTMSQTLTTTQKPDVIVALLVVNDTTTSVTSVSDTALLSWTLRASQKGPSNVQVFLYYAIAETFLLADNLTFGLSSGAVGTDCQDFGVSGANTAAPFDSNWGMPNKNGGNSTVTSLTYNTSDPYDFLIILQGWCAPGTTASGSPQNFLLIGTAHSRPSNCPADFLQSTTYYQVVSATQASKAVSWAFTTQNATFAVIGDAIQSTPYVSSISSFHGLSGSSITMTGTSFNGTTSVDFCGAKATFTVVSDTSITATLPPCGAGNSLDIAVTNAVGTSPTSPNDLFFVDPVPPLSVSISASPPSFSLGEKVTFTVSTSGGYGALSYSYSNLPTGCVSTNATTLSCTPTSIGNHDVTVRVTDHAGKSAAATVGITVGPEWVLGLPPTMGLALVFAAIAGISAIVIVLAVLTLRRKKRHKAPTTT